MRTMRHFRDVYDRGLGATCAAITALGLCLAAPATGQNFDSGSTGVDGDLVVPPTCNGGSGVIVDWDPVLVDGNGDPVLDAAELIPLDQDGDSVFEFGSITIPVDCHLRLTVAKLGVKPIHFLASGPVVIDGTLSLQAFDGHPNTLGSVRSPAVPGPGGFAGGLGQVAGTGARTDGFGPGAGLAELNRGGGAGHLNPGTNDFVAAVRGPAYGNVFLLPLVGGSGGGGANSGGGGAGGGAILIASSDSISVTGTVTVRGGDGNSTAGNDGGGGGSGGSIRLAAPMVLGGGILSAGFGLGGGTFSRAEGSVGRIRVEAFDHQFTGTATSGAVFVTLAPTTTLFSDLVEFPLLRIVRVEGQDVPDPPSGMFVPSPDVTINTADPSLIEIESENVPEGTVVTVEVHSESIGTATVLSTPLTGATDPRTATASVNVDAGFSLITLRADFGP